MVGQEGGRVPVQPQRPLDGELEVAGLDRPSVGVSESLAEPEGIGQSILGDRGQAPGQTGQDRAPGRTGGPLEHQQRRVHHRVELDSLGGEVRLVVS